MQVLLAAAGEPWEVHVLEALQRRASPLVLVRRCMDVADAVATAASGQADAVLLSRALGGLDSDVVARIAETGAVPVGLVGGSGEGVGKEQGDDDAAVLTRMGVACLVRWDALDTLPDLLREHSEAEQRGSGSADAELRPEEGFADHDVPGPGAPLPLGRVIACWGPTGAPGRSTVALGLASELSARSVPTLLVDADVYGGALGTMLALLDEVSGVIAAARSAGTGSLTLAGLHGHVLEIEPYLRVLTGVPRADRWPQLRPSAMQQLLHSARQMAPLVILDCAFNLEQDEELSFDTAAPQRNGATLTLLARADTVLVVGSADPLGLSRLARGVLDLREAVPGADVAVVVNRVRPGLGWSTDEIGDTVERFTGLRPVAYLPDDRAATDKAWVTGRTLRSCASGSPLTRALGALAAELAGLPATGRRRQLRFARAVKA
ncbi:MAG: AAA family ATPase [Nocardioidaceae bacterium]